VRATPHHLALHKNASYNATQYLNSNLAQVFLLRALPVLTEDTVQVLVGVAGGSSPPTLHLLETAPGLREARALTFAVPEMLSEPVSGVFYKRLPPCACDGRARILYTLLA
jgi:hypothetical protein